MNKNLSGYTKKELNNFLFILIAFSFIFTGLSSLFVLLKNMFVDKHSIAIVNSIPIESNEYEKLIRVEEYRLEMYKEKFGELLADILPALRLKNDPRENALESLIAEKILLSSAQNIGISLSPQYVASVLKNKRLSMSIFGEILPPTLFNRIKGLDLQKLPSFLTRRGMTMHEFENLIEHTLIEKILRESLKSSYGLVKSELERLQLTDYAHRTYLIKKIFYKNVPNNKMNITDEEALLYYQQHKSSKHYWKEEKRSGNIWIFKEHAYYLTESQKSEEGASFEKQFMEEVQNIVSAPPVIFDSFIKKKNGIKSVITNLKKFDAQHEQDSFKSLLSNHFFMLSKGKKNAFFNDEIGYIIELTDVEKGILLPFEQVKEKIIEDVKKEKVIKEIKSHFEKSLLPESSTSSPTLSENISKIEWSPLKTILSEDEVDPLMQQWNDLEKSGIATKRMLNMFRKGQNFIGETEEFVYLVTLENVVPVETFTEKDSKAVLFKVYQQGQQELQQQFIDFSRKNATVDLRGALRAQ